MHTTQQRTSDWRRGGAQAQACTVRLVGVGRCLLGCVWTRSVERRTETSPVHQRKSLRQVKDLLLPHAFPRPMSLRTLSFFVSTIDGADFRSRRLVSRSVHWHAGNDWLTVGGTGVSVAAGLAPLQHSRLLQRWTQNEGWKDENVRA